MIKTLQLIWKAITVPQQDTVALWRKIAFLDGVSLRCRRCRPCKICIILNPRSKILIQSFPQNSWISIHSFPTRLLFLKIPDRRTVSVLHLERHIPKNTFCWNRAIFFLYVLQNNFLQIGTENYPRSHGSKMFKVSFDHEKHHGKLRHFMGPIPRLAPLP